MSYGGRGNLLETTEVLARGRVLRGILRQWDGRPWLKVKLEDVNGGLLGGKPVNGQQVKEFAREMIRQSECGKFGLIGSVFPEWLGIQRTFTSQKEWEKRGGDTYINVMIRVLKSLRAKTP